MSKERLRKADPPRTEPIRDWEQLFRHPQPGETPFNGTSSDKKTENGANGRAWDDAVTHAVKLGYRIVEEQIKQGKKIAEQVSEQTATEQSVGGDVSDFVRRLLQFYTDIGATCFDFIDSMTRSKEFSDNVRGWVEDGLAMSGSKDSVASADSGTSMTVPIDICSTHPARVSLQLNQQVENVRLTVPGLYALDSSHAPLQQVEFRYESDQQPPTLTIRVPGDQPADTYTGVVVDSSTNQPCGTLTVQVRHEAESTR